MLLLAMALLILGMAAIIPSIKFEIERDREEEMIHRGVQYERAIKLYYKKFGRYPAKIEDLQNTNNIRFLRKRYKDPTNCRAGKCEDFKLLHFGEVKLALTGGFGGGAIPGASPIGSQGGLGQTSTFGMGNGLGQTTTLGGNNSFGGNSNSTFGANQPSDTQQLGQNDQSGAQASEPNGATTQGAPVPGTTEGDQLSTQVFGGGPIIGVASLSKTKGYREFNQKRKYNEWQFIYDPSADRGGLLMTPYQPLLQGFGQQGTQNLNGPNNGGNSPGNSSSFSTGTSSGTMPPPPPPAQQPPTGQPNYNEGPEVPQPNNSPD